MSRTAKKLARLKERNLPTWFDDAKFGIFIHWGAFAIPAFAPAGTSFSDELKADYDQAVPLTPYSEWYGNAMRVEGSPTQKFHQENYGDAPYRDFKEPFEAGLEHWDPAAWAEEFRNAGARYVVLVTKHHDGLCLWPTRYENPHEADWATKRDIVREMADAVRAAGMRFGLYYSGGIDWTFHRKAAHTFGEFLASMPGGDYPDYAMAQVRELIDLYKPDVLWNDISWPTRLGPLLDLFDDYYRAVPEGVVNDRWIERNWKMDLLKFRPFWRALDRKLKEAFEKRSPDEKGLVPPPVPHSDFCTPEFSILAETQKKKWESTRGMSHGFGFRRDDGPNDYASAEELIHGFIDTVARNGNLLLNVGPRGEDASIPQEQIDILRQFGAWLSVNGDAIYGTRPWKRSDGVTACGQEIRFTQGKQGVNLIFKGRMAADNVVVKDFSILGMGTATRLSDGSAVSLKMEGSDMRLTYSNEQSETGSADPIATVIQIKGTIT